MRLLIGRTEDGREVSEHHPLIDDRPLDRSRIVLAYEADDGEYLEIFDVTDYCGVYKVCTPDPDWNPDEEDVYDRLIPVYEGTYTQCYQFCMDYLQEHSKPEASHGEDGGRNYIETVYDGKIEPITADYIQKICDRFDFENKSE